MSVISVNQVSTQIANVAGQTDGCVIIEEFY